MPQYMNVHSIRKTVKQILLFWFGVVLHIEILDNGIYQLWLGQRDCAVVITVDPDSKEISNHSLILDGEVLF